MLCSRNRSMGSASQSWARLIEADVAVNRLRHAQAALAVRFDALGGAAMDGLPTAASWLRAKTTAAPGESAELVRVGRQLRDRLPNTDAALAAGDISWRAAATIAHGLRNVAEDGVVRRG